MDNYDKAAAFDTLVDELIALRTHLQALGATWEHQSRAQKTGRESNTRKDHAHGEYCRGRGDGYEIAAGKIDGLIEGMGI